MNLVILSHEKTFRQYKNSMHNCFSSFFINHFKTLQASSSLSLDVHMTLKVQSDNCYNFCHVLNLGPSTNKMYRHCVCIVPHRALVQSLVSIISSCFFPDEI